MSRAKAETIRRLRQGNMIRLCRHRYGTELPDDDAGRDSLFDLLCIASLAIVDPVRKMANLIEVQAPWVSDTDCTAMVDAVNRAPVPERWRIAKTLGHRHRITNLERERLKLWMIAPCDMRSEELAEQRRAKDKLRKRRKRLEQKCLTQKAYLAQFANSINQTKPWEADGISKATWYRRRGP